MRHHQTTIFDFLPGESTNELAVMAFDPLIVSPGEIEFNEYERLKNEATELSEKIHQIEVNEENIKITKKLLATVNKRVKELDSRRITIKKEILSPYTLFESQVKEIVGIVKEADHTVRNQIRELEEQEREMKRSEIEKLFDRRMKHYSFNQLFSFNDFINSKHLNKATSMNAIESDMVEWLEKIEAELKLIELAAQSQEVLTEYIETKDLTKAMAIVANRKERKQSIQEQSKIVGKSMNESYLITMEDPKDVKLVERFMQQNDIPYQIEKVEN